MPTQSLLERKSEKKKRTLGFWAGAGKGDLNTHFGKLRDKDRFYFQASFDLWAEELVRPDRYHRWDASQSGGKYKDCIVFSRKPSERIYGHLFRPAKALNCTLCILFEYSKKTTFHTNPAILDKIIEYAKDSTVLAEVKKYFEE